MAAKVIFLLDVDNTLLDNDHIVADLRDHLEREFGSESRDRYWAIFEALRAELGYGGGMGLEAEGPHRPCLHAALRIHEKHTTRIEARAVMLLSAPAWGCATGRRWR